ncbi:MULTISPECIES: hypothetical protein [unclassified Mesorhizobium]
MPFVDPAGILIIGAREKPDRGNPGASVDSDGSRYELNLQKEATKPFHGDIEQPFWTRDFLGSARMQAVFIQRPTYGQRTPAPWLDCYALICLASNEFCTILTSLEF